VKTEIPISMNSTKPVIIVSEPHFVIFV
jgi:hypothetical protein